MGLTSSRRITIAKTLARGRRAVQPASCGKDAGLNARRTGRQLTVTGSTS
jgi:hypothetical protein